MLNPSPDFLCFGHRGAKGHEPENTLRSIRRALELGANGIEIDVYCVEGQLIVIHDDTLERTTNGMGFVWEHTFAQLRALDAGKGERIPTLAEVFDCVNHRAIINVELKGPDTAAPVTALIDEYVKQRGWRHDEFLISSFDYVQLRRVKELQAKLRLGVLLEHKAPDYAKVATELRAYAVHPNLKSVNASFVRVAHERGLKVFVYTVNRPADIAQMKRLGVDGVFSDFPERVAC